MTKVDSKILNTCPADKPSGTRQSSFFWQDLFLLFLKPWSDGFFPVSLASCSIYALFCIVQYINLTRKSFILIPV